MAKKQTRRTVSMSRATHDALTEYARQSLIPAAALVEYALRVLLSEPLDTAKFQAWFGARALDIAERKLAGQHASGLDKYRQRTAERAPRIAELEARRAERKARQERAAHRAQIRAATGAKRLCAHCDGPHLKATCPLQPHTPRETGSKSEIAAKMACAGGLKLREAAERYGVSKQSVQQAVVRMFGSGVRGLGAEVAP